MERNFKYFRGRKFYLSTRRSSIKATYPKLIRAISEMKNGKIFAYVEDFGEVPIEDENKRMFEIEESELFDFYTALTPKGVCTVQVCVDTRTKENGVFLIFNKYIKEDYIPEDIKDADVVIISLSKELDRLASKTLGVDLKYKKTYNYDMSPLSIFEPYQLMPLNSIINTDRFNLKGSIPEIIYDPDGVIDMKFKGVSYLYYEDNYESLKGLIGIENLSGTFKAKDSENGTEGPVTIKFSSIYNNLDSRFIDGNLCTILNCFPMVGVDSYDEFVKLYGELVIGDYKDKDEFKKIKYNSLINLLYILCYTTMGDPVLLTILTNNDIDYKLKYIELDKVGFKKYEYDHISTIRNNDPKYKIVLVKFDNDEIAILKLKVVKDLDLMKIGNSEDDTMSEEEFSKFMNLS